MAAAGGITKKMETLREMITRHEGRRLKPYRCPSGFLTVGMGYNIDTNPLPVDIAAYLRMQGEITEEMADRLLTIMLGVVTLQCHAIYAGFEGFSEVRRNALIDFVYNVGARTAQKFKKMRAAVETGNWETAADELKDSVWFNQVGTRGPDIVGMIREG
jgi:lysozyme